MGVSTVTDWVEATAAILTSLFAFAALFLAWRAPRAAARWANDFRVRSDAELQREQLRLNIFAALMKGRAEITDPESVAALNLIDVAFVADRSVRETFREFMLSVHKKPPNPDDIRENYIKICKAVADKIGFGDNISIADIRNGYYPEILGQIKQAALVQAKGILGSANSA